MIAAVRFASPLPQLDREYDYLVRSDIELTVGSLVEVPFGSGKKPKLGIVVETKTQSEHSGELASVTKVVSKFPQTSSSVLELCSLVAQRQASTFGEVLSFAIPKRFVRAEKNIEPKSLENIQSVRSKSLLIEALQESQKVHFTPELVSTSSGVPDWAIEFANSALHFLLQGKSSLIVLPDYREVKHFELALQMLNLESFSVRHVSTDSGSDRYSNHILASLSIAINYGTRTSCFTPVKELGFIALWDDGDESHIEQSAPYWNSREVLLQRQQTENTHLVISSHSPSAESLRLIDLGYLTPVTTPGSLPLVRVTDSFTRLDDETFGLISKRVSERKPVLIQIANAGWASAIACSNCKELRKCPNCKSGIWIDPAGFYRCRSCKQVDSLPTCDCGSSNTRPVRIGATAIADQLRRIFPGAEVLESSGDNPLISTTASAVLVVATPGAEPDVAGGYDLVVISDAAQMIGAPRLKALEKAVGSWANAISLGSKDCVVIFVGLSGDLSEQVKRLDFNAIVRADFQDRASLGLPPSTRVASITVSNRADFQSLKLGLEESSISQRLKYLPSADPLTLVVDYQYGDGLEFAEVLKALTTKLTTQSKHKQPGERVYRINMDDSKVI